MGRDLRRRSEEGDYLPAIVFQQMYRLESIRHSGTS